jgi:hypothetical protein
MRLHPPERIAFEVLMADRFLAPAGPARAGAFLPARRGPDPDEATAVGEKRGVDEVALIAGPHCRGVVARPAPPRHSSLRYDQRWSNSGPFHVR